MLSHGISLWIAIDWSLVHGKLKRGRDEMIEKIEWS